MLGPKVLEQKVLGPKSTESESESESESELNLGQPRVGQSKK